MGKPSETLSARASSGATGPAPASRATRSASSSRKTAAPPVNRSPSREYRKNKHAISAHFGAATVLAFKQAHFAAVCAKGDRITVQDFLGAGLVLLFTRYSVPVPDELAALAPCRSKKGIAIELPAPEKPVPGGKGMPRPDYRKNKHLIGGHFGGPTMLAFKQAAVAVSLAKGQLVKSQDLLGVALALLLRHYSVPLPEELARLMPCRIRKFDNKQGALGRG